MNPLIQLKKATPPFLFVFVLACFALSPTAEAVVPAPDGGYPGGNTAEGQNALFSLTTGGFNTAVGWSSLLSNVDKSFNTAVGAGTLLANTADGNTATGAGALLSNTTGENNTANGTFALLSNTTGFSNTAIGDNALFSNTAGIRNTAVGDVALASNTGGGDNTAIGYFALASHTTGGGNIALGSQAGIDVTTANNVICIGFAVRGQNVDHSCFIGEIFGATSSLGTAVFINSNGRLGTVTSSRRFKEKIKPMDKASEAIHALNPVTFRYKKGIDPQGIPQFGLVAEDVEKVNPDLVVRDKEGKPYSVRYDQVNAMLLNEFLKEHRKVTEQDRKIWKQETIIAQLTSTVAKQGATVAHQQEQIDALNAGLQKVSAQIETSKVVQNVARNNP